MQPALRKNSYDREPSESCGCSEVGAAVVWVPQASGSSATLEHTSALTCTPPAAGSQPHGNSLFNVMFPLAAVSAAEPYSLLGAGRAPSQAGNISSLPLGFPLPTPFLFGGVCVSQRASSLPSL